MTAKFNTHALLCQGYSVSVHHDELISINVDFVMQVPGRADSETLMEALHNIGIFMNSGEVNLVKATDKLRCFHCGVLAGDDDRTCTQCGAPL